jgi:hypothetical protein
MLSLLVFISIPARRVCNLCRKVGYALYHTPLHFGFLCIFVWQFIAVNSLISWRPYSTTLVPYWRGWAGNWTLLINRSDLKEAWRVKTKQYRISYYAQKARWCPCAYLVRLILKISIVQHLGHYVGKIGYHTQELPNRYANCFDKSDPC